jgi:hypothetical protein
MKKQKSCDGGVSAEDIEFVMHDASGDRCMDLFKYDDYPNDIHGWQNFFAGLVVSEDSGKYVIRTTRSKAHGGHVNLSRNLHRLLDTIWWSNVAGGQPKFVHMRPHTRMLQQREMTA